MEKNCDTCKYNNIKGMINPPCGNCVKYSKWVKSSEELKEPGGLPKVKNILPAPKMKPPRKRNVQEERGSWLANEVGEYFKSIVARNKVLETRNKELRNAFSNLKNLVNNPITDTEGYSVDKHQWASLVIKIINETADTILKEVQ